MGKVFYSNPNDPVVQTKYGKVRGYCYDGIYAFLGVPYAKAKRFMMPEPPDCWEGIRKAVNMGYVSPVMRHALSADSIPRRFGAENENCHNLNVWTPSLDSAAKKPVIVFFHGGGFSDGSALGHLSYDGDSMSKFGDVVMVNVNHRLNILGFLNLEDFGEKYRNSGNAGLADLVASLEWVRDNIAAFGGDPDNVTIFGQSGGGGKVNALMQTPAADGLFHKALIMSGFGYGIPDTNPRSGKAIALAMLKELGLGEESVAVLEELPYSKLTELFTRVEPALDEQEGISTNWAPLQNDYYVGTPYDVGFTEHSKTLPLVVGTVFGEMYSQLVIENKDSLTDEQAMEQLQTIYGEHTPKVVELFRKAYPEKDIIDLMYFDITFRKRTEQYLQLRAAEASAPVYDYVFALNQPIDHQKPAWHASEMAFVFHNVERVPEFNNPGVSEVVEEEFSGAWVSFAHTGDPSYEKGSGLWPAYTTEHPMTKVFDAKTDVREDFDRELVDYIFDHVPSRIRFTKKKTGGPSGY